MAPIVAKMVKKNQSLVTMRFTNANDITPVLVAYTLGHWEIARFLYSLTPIHVLTQDNSGRDGAQLITECFFQINKFDIGWDLLQKCPKLALTETYATDRSPLYALAGSRFAFSSGVPLRFWQRWIYNNIHVQQPQPAPINSDVCVNFEELEDDKRNPRDLISSGSLSAHLNHIQGAALQMQRELQWFKEVERILHPQHLEVRNKTEQITARELFTKNHKKLVKEGEESMKGTTTSCTVVGALIVTNMFAAAFTVPSGNNQDTGFPIFLRKKFFRVFLISDSISLLSSTTSVMIFLGILTSRYAEDDFLRSLPTKMLLGLFTLFLSIAAMMVAFSSALFIMLEGESWVSIPISLLARVPIASFVWMQFPLFLDIFMFTYGRGIFDKKCRAWE
ncbi:uncharacterized protein LOC117621953 [Prunus dulcis]|uniref:uncharacterized protein LOC117621953 n=1 Tax=Prunus dulcis TaxID=3755 RepID=UPI0014834D70|nr:uncharacterized protein LOC117621953 [Prunus dulcis]